MNDTGSPELLPCPFCGVVPRIGYDGTSHFIQCGGAGCIIRPGVAIWEKEHVISTWNLRSEPAGKETK